MKRLLVLTVLMMLAASAVGCRNCSWFRGTFLNPEPEVVCDPCAPMLGAQPGVCAPCAGGAVPGAATLTPGPSGYVPAG